MSGAFLAAVTVDWFHVVQMFTKAVDDVRRAEAKHGKLPKSLAGPSSSGLTAASPMPRQTPSPNSKRRAC